MGRLRDLDDRALNAWWGLLVVPFAWITYRAGRRWADKVGRKRAYLLLGPVGGRLFNRGRDEGKPLS